MYFRTCGWVCLQSLIFPCLVFVLVLGRGGAPERWPSHRTEQSKPRRPLPSIPPWSWRFRLSRVLVKAPEDQPSHTLQRLPFFDITIYVESFIHTICFSKIQNLYFNPLIQQNLPVAHPRPLKCLWFCILPGKPAV